MNSLGVGGTNAHAIVEEAPRSVVSARAGDDGKQILILSAKSKKALDQSARNLAAALKRDPSLALSDAAYTLATGRKHFEHRRIVAVHDRNDAISVLDDIGSRRHFHAYGPSGDTERRLSVSLAAVLSTRNGS